MRAKYGKFLKPVSDDTSRPSNSSFMFSSISKAKEIVATGFFNPSMLFCAILDAIWQARNKKRFQGAMPSQQSVLYQAYSSYQDWNRAFFEEDDIPYIMEDDDTNPTTSYLSWIKPPPGWVKLNFDASFNRESSHACLAVVGRNSEGFSFGRNESHCRDDNLEEAAKVLNQMVKKGCSVNTSTFNPIFRCIMKLKDVNAAHRMYTKMKEMKCTLNTVTYNVLIKMFAEFKSADMAFKLKQEMDENEVEPNVNTYRVLISLFCRIGHWVRAHKFLIEMLEEKCLRPTLPMYESVLLHLRKAKQIKKHEELVEKIVDRGFVTRPL
ncbi:hypothetical protein IFM89_014468 [Coptis chinensis]|uniref:Pentatricopeptide repeat-containing protein n=1 Tax=Coptis chinensis TaxID=261450 RepID=A0A835I2D4_9MAGN|nr:hypothetical protein IFM89_014468 [Coptis chinensis]